MVCEIPFPHPGEILLEEFLKPMGITQYRLSKEIGAPQRRIGEIVAGKRAITVDTGLRLSALIVPPTIASLLRWPKHLA
jgi:addiction module HigA family antidote